MSDFPDLPDFLRAEVSSQAKLAPEQQAAWEARKAVIKKTVKREKRTPFHLPRNIEPGGLALLKQMEKQKEEAAKERFELLKIRAAAKRALMAEVRAHRKGKSA